MDTRTQSDRICVVCMKDMPAEANFCPNCGHSYADIAEVEMGKKVGSILPIIGGLSILVVGLMDIASGLVSIGDYAAYPSYESGIGILRLQALAGVVLIVVGIIALFSGWLAFNRRYLGFSLAGAISALGSIGVIWGTSNHAFLATSLALVGVIFIALAMDEFEY